VTLAVEAATYAVPTSESSAVYRKQP